jgi:DNA-binding transcriptional LysR family regulator
LSAWLLPTAIERLSRRYPRITVRAFQQDINTVEFRQLHDRNVDLVINRVPKNLVADNLDIEVLLDDRHFVVTGPKSPWARRRKIALSELVNEQWLLPPNPVVVAVLQQAFEAEGLKVPSGRVTADSVLLRIELLATGRFLSVLSDSVLRSVAMQLPFKVLPIDLRTAAPPIAIIKLKNRTLTPVAQLLIEHLREVAKSVSAQAKVQKS